MPVSGVTPIDLVRDVYMGKENDTTFSRGIGTKLQFGPSSAFGPPLPANRPLLPPANVIKQRVVTSPRTRARNSGVPLSGKPCGSTRYRWSLDFRGFLS
jgi:hypothetical protein